MTHPAVQWTLDAIADNWPAGSFGDIPVRRIDRDNAEILEGDVRSASEDLQDSNLVGATHADRTTTPIGTEFDLDIETVVGVRIQGAHASEWGYVDEDASLPPATAGEPVPWTPFVDAIKDAIWQGRTFPDTGQADVSFTHLLITNPAPQASNWADYYRYDFDVAFSGFEELP